MNTRNKILEYIDKLKPSKILDLGCGKGNISKIFINQNSKVVCIDKEDFSQNFPESVKFIKQDLKNLNIEEDFDLIIMSRVLHLMPKEDALELIKKMQDKTSTNGFNFLLCMSEKENKKRKDFFYPSAEELKIIYSNWDIKSEEFETDLEEHDNFLPHKHSLIIFLAKKKN